MIKGSTRKNNKVTRRITVLHQENAPLMLPKVLMIKNEAYLLSGSDIHEVSKVGCRVKRCGLR